MSNIVVLPLVFDNDCLASFLWVKRTDIIKTLYNSNMIVPNTVVRELDYLRKSRYSFVCSELDEMLNDEYVTIETLPAAGPLAEHFNQLEKGVLTGVELGKGEAAAIVIAQYLECTLASNNLKDIQQYCDGQKIPYICTDNILYEAYVKEIISIDDGQDVWEKMKKRGRALPRYDFYECVRRFENGIGR